MEILAGQLSFCDICTDYNSTKCNGCPIVRIKQEATTGGQSERRFRATRKKSKTKRTR